MKIDMRKVSLPELVRGTPQRPQSLLSFPAQLVKKIVIDVPDQTDRRVFDVVRLSCPDGSQVQPLAGFPGDRSRPSKASVKNSLIHLCLFGDCIVLAMRSLSKAFAAHE
jgi:hypothetical protein